MVFDKTKYIQGKVDGLIKDLCEEEGIYSGNTKILRRELNDRISQLFTTEDQKEFLKILLVSIDKISDVDRERLMNFFYVLDMVRQEYLIDEK